MQTQRTGESLVSLILVGGEKEYPLQDLPSSVAEVANVKITKQERKESQGNCGSALAIDCLLTD